MDGYFADVGRSLLPSWLATPDGQPLLCDTSVRPPRPIIPQSATLPLLRQVHSLSHPGGNAMLRLVRRRFVWRHMASQVKAFCRACLPCQRAKIVRHTKTPLAPLEMPDHRFSVIHLDLVGPLPEAEGCQYLLTIIAVSYTHLTLPTNREV